MQYMHHYYVCIYRFGVAVMGHIRFWGILYVVWNSFEYMLSWLRSSWFSTASSDCYMNKNFILYRIASRSPTASLWTFSVKYLYWELSVNGYMRSSLFWDFTQPRFVVRYRRFGRICPCPLQDGAGSFPQTSVTEYQSTLRKIPEERRFHIHRRGSLISLVMLAFFDINYWTLAHTCGKICIEYYSSVFFQVS